MYAAAKLIWITAFDTLYINNPSNNNWETTIFLVYILLLCLKTSRAVQTHEFDLLYSFIGSRSNLNQRNTASCLLF